MGEYNMSIQGHGLHDNTAEEYQDRDADKLFAKFVDSLKEAGHEITSAHFTVGNTRSF